MRCVVQRVSRASVTIDGMVVAEIQTGLLVLLGIEQNDTPDDVDWLVKKVTQLRIFADSEGMMNLNVSEVNGDMLVVSQFTLFASTKKGNRPGFSRSAPPEKAIPLYEEFVRKAESISGKQVQTGRFGAHMQVELVNQGPVTIVIDTQSKE